MKILNRILYALITTVICLGAFAIYSFAEDSIETTFTEISGVITEASDVTSAAVAETIVTEASDTTDSVEVLISNPIGGSKTNIQSIINDKVYDGIVSERYNGFSIERPAIYTYDTSIYLLEYNVSTDYWNKVSSMDYKGLTEAPRVIDYDHPTIYIPLFGDITDTEGNNHNRAIGYIRLYYNWSDKDYRFNMALYNLTSDNFKDKKKVGFYEEISEYLNQSKTDAQQVFLIRYPSSLTDGHEKIAVIQTKDDTVILDISNTLNIPDNKIDPDKAPVYSISEYSSLRKEVEKKLYQQSNGWDENPAGGNANLSQAPKQNSYGIWILCIFIVLFIAGTVMFILLRRRRNNQTKQTAYDTAMGILDKDTVE